MYHLINDDFRGHKQNFSSTKPTGDPLWSVTYSFDWEIMKYWLVVQVFCHECEPEQTKSKPAAYLKVLKWFIRSPHDSDIIQPLWTLNFSKTIYDSRLANDLPPFVPCHDGRLPAFGVSLKHMIDNLYSAGGMEISGLHINKKFNDTPLVE